MPTFENLYEILEFKKKEIVIVGGGTIGGLLYHFLSSDFGISFCQIKKNNLQNIFITDKNDEVVKQYRNGILERDLINYDVDKAVFILAFRSLEAVNWWKERLDALGVSSDDMYWYYPYDGQKTRERFEKIGYFRNMKLSPLENVDNLMAQNIEHEIPFFASRWGATEGAFMLSRFFNVDTNPNSLENNSGVFPVSDDTLLKEYYDETKKAALAVDYLLDGVWCRNLELLRDIFCPQAKLTRFTIIPSQNDCSYLQALKGKRVLVIHPFAYLMKEQYKNRLLIFKKPEFPEFEMIPYKAINSLGGQSPKGISNWCEALALMESDISKIEFDVALLGCGAYGMPLGAYIKRELKKTAIHVGGSLQLFFGIKGGRWDNSNMYNEYWVRPGDELKPLNYKNVEGGCYW